MTADVFGFYAPGRKPTPNDLNLNLPRVRGRNELLPYQYQSIDALREIRLIELLPPRTSCQRNSDELLRCKIHHTTVNDEGSLEYEALSYTWGAFRPYLPISIAPSEDPTLKGSRERELFVTPQLMTALRRLRLLSESRMLWIDQLSINQDDNEEKGQQVKRMGEIYAAAKKVVIWLGEEGKDTRTLPPLLDKISKRSESSEGEDAEILKDEISFNFTYHDVSLEQQHVDAIRDILAREWFTRAWVFQEACLAKEIVVQLGSLEIPFDALRRLLVAVELLESFTQHIGKLGDKGPGLGMIRLIHDTRTAVFEPNSRKLAASSKALLSVLLRALRRVEASDARDLVYAFLAFQSPSSENQITPNYNEPKKKVWTDSSRCIIRNTKNLDIFAALSGEMGEEPDDIPSWVPKWSQYNLSGPPIASPFTGTSFCASRDIPFVWSQEEGSSERLVVRGRIVDVMDKYVPHEFRGKLQNSRWSSGLKSYLPDSEDFPFRVFQWLLFVGHLSNDQARLRYLTLGADLMRCVLADGALAAGQPLEDIHGIIDILKMSEQVIEWRKSGKIGKLPDNEREIVRKYEDLEQLALVTEGKKLFKTRGFQFGLVTSVAREGDVVAIIHGSRAPCILRKLSEDSRNYKIISQCYLDGWMYGNPPPGHPCARWWEDEPEIFILY